LVFVLYVIYTENLAHTIPKNMEGQLRFALIATNQNLLNKKSWKGYPYVFPHVLHCQWFDLTVHWCLCCVWVVILFLIL